MYLTAHRVRSKMTGAEGVHAFRYRHDVESWQTPPDPRSSWATRTSWWLPDLLAQGKKAPGIVVHELGHRVWFHIAGQKSASVSGCQPSKRRGRSGQAQDELTLLQLLGPSGMSCAA